MDEPRPGRPRTITDEDVERVITKTLETTPKDATHWSTRSLAADLGLSQSAVSRIWRAFGLQPHREDTWKLSRDPLFVDKVRDVVGLYLDPPERAVVLCVDEKTQIQALDRTAPVLPMLPGTPARASHDYVRAGTSSLYAALDTATGKVIGVAARPAPSDRVQEVPGQPRPEVPAGPGRPRGAGQLRHPQDPRGQEVAGLAHPRFTLHFTPTSASWLNLVERWFAELTTKKLQRGTHRSVHALNTDIRAWIAGLERRPPPLRLDQDRRRDPRLHQPILHAN